MERENERQENFESTFAHGSLKGLTPNVVRLGIVSFFADVSSEMLYPLTPLFLTGVLGAPMAVVGLIEGVAEAIASVLKGISGWLSDLSGKRRPFIFAGYSLSALAKPLIALASAWPLVLVARVADRFGKGLRSSPRDALLGDSISPEFRGRAFGWHWGMDTLGAVVGPLLALGLLALFQGDLRKIFLFAFFPGALGAFLVLTLRERPRAPQTIHPSIRFRKLPPAFQRYLFAWGAFSVANSSDVFLIMKAKQIGFPTANVIALYMLYNLIYAAASPSLGRLSDRLGRKRVLIGGLGVFASVYLGFALSNQLWQLWGLFAVYGLYTAATDGVGKAFAVDLVPSNIRGSAIGMLGTVTGIAALAASSIAGLLWTFFGPGAAFIYGTAGALLGMALLSQVPETSRS